MAFANGELLAVSRAIKLGISTGVLRGAAGFRGVDAAYGGGAKESPRALSVSAPEFRTLRILWDALPLNIRRGSGMVIRKHRNHMLTAMFFPPADDSVISAAGVRPKERALRENEKREEDERRFHDHSWAIPAHICLQVK